MALVTIPGGCNTSFSNGDGFVNYGSVSSAPAPFASFPVYFALPYDGYIQYASVSTTPAPSAATSFQVNNLDTATSASGLMPLDNVTREAFSTLPSGGVGSLIFSAGDRIVWSAGPNMTSTSTVLTNYCELNTPGDSEFLAVVASLNGGFTAGENPYSFGAGAKEAQGGSIEIRLPVDTILNSIAVTANESGAVLSSNAILEIYNSGIISESVTILSGTDVLTQTFGTPRAFDKNDVLFMRAGNTIGGLNHSVVVLLFEVTGS